MSEDEAKTKWCPMVRAGSTYTGLGSLNRDHANHSLLPVAACIGSACMMWRWYRTHINDGAGGPMIVSTDTHGFCGLAGHWFEDKRT